MNRRHFIHTLLLTAGAVTAGAAQPWQRDHRALGLAFKHQPKFRIPLELTSAEAELARVFGADTRSLYLFGGPVLARLEGRETSYANFLVDCDNFTRLKTKLFQFGVEPISTPEMPGSFIKFAFEDRIYNVMNCEIEEFCQRNRTHAKVKLVPFAHNFLIYDCQRRELTDPCNALETRGKGGPPEIILVARPRSIVESFDIVLSGRFERHLLGFEPSEDLLDFEQFILSSECPPENVARMVERTVNYIPDAIEMLGEEAASEIALSTLVRSGVRAGLEIEMAKVWRGLRRATPADQSATFLARVKEEMGMDRNSSGFQDRLTLYLATNGYSLRRLDLSVQLMTSA